MNIGQQTNIGEQTNVEQAPGSISQIAHGNQVTQTASTGGPPERRVAWWARVLMALCVLGALAALVLGILDRLDWLTAGVIIVALLGALPFIERFGT